MAEGGGLLNRYRLVKAYRGFESLRLRQSIRALNSGVAREAACCSRVDPLIDVDPVAVTLAEL